MKSYPPPELPPPQPIKAKAVIVDKAKAFIFFIYFSLFYFVFCIIHKVLYKVIITFSNNICTNFIKLYYFTMLALRLALYFEKVWEILKFVGGLFWV